MTSRYLPQFLERPGLGVVDVWAGLTGNHARSQVSSTATGVTHFDLRRTTRNLLIRVQPVPQQSAIPDISTPKPASSTAWSTDGRTIERLQELRSALIAAVVTGKFPVAEW